MALRKDFLAMLGGAAESINKPSAAPVATGVRKDFLDMLGGNTNSQPISRAPFGPSLPSPAVKQPTQFLYNGQPVAPAAPRTPSLAELNRVDKTQQIAPVSSLPTNPLAKLISNKVDRFTSNPANGSSQAGAAPVWAQAPLGAAEAVLDMPAGAEKAAQMAAHGVTRAFQPKPKGTFIPTLPSLNRDQGVNKLKTDIAAMNAPQSQPKPVPFADSSRLTAFDQTKGTLEGYTGTAATKGVGKALFGAGQMAVNILQTIYGGSAPIVAASAGMAAKEAEKAGATMDEQFANAFIVGAVTAVGYSKLGNAISNALEKKLITPGIKNAITRMIGTMGESGVVNMAQGIATNAAAQGTYDPSRQIINPKELGQQFVSGALGGSLFHLPRIAGEVRASMGNKTGDSTAATTNRVVVDPWILGDVTTEIGKRTARTTLKKQYETNLAGKTVKIASDGRDVFFTSDGFDKPETHSANPDILYGLAHLRDIVEKAEPVIEPGQTKQLIRPDDKHRQNVKGYLDYKTVLEIGDYEVPLRVVVRVDNNGNAYYDHNVFGERAIRKADPSKPSRSVPENVTRITADQPSNSITPPNAADVNAPNGSIPADVAGNPELNVRWKPEEVEAMASGREPLPEDLGNLMALAEHVADLQDSGRMDLQHFAATVSQKVSKVYENTFKQNGLDKEFPEIFNSQTFVYDPRTEKAQLQKANAMINANPEGEFKRVTALDGEEMTADDVNVSGELMKKEMDLLRMNPENPDAIRRVRALADTLRQAGTSGGQQIQAFAKYSRRTPEGFTALANKLMDKVEETLPEGPKEQFNKETKAIEDMGRQVEQEAAQKLADELDGAGIIPEPAGLPKEPGTAQQPTDAAGTGNTGRDTARDGTSTVVDEPSFAEQLASKISDYADIKKKGDAPDPVQDMLNELLRLAKESPIEDVRAAARKARNPVQFALQALDAWPRYKQVYADAQGLLKAKYADNSDMLARLNEFFGTDTRPPISTQTLSAIVRNGLNDVGIKMTDILNNNDMRKKLVNHIIESTGAKGDPAYFLRNFLNERLNVIQAEFNKKQMKVTDPDARYRLLYSLYETNLKKEFVPSHIKPALKDFVTGLDAPTKASGTSGKASIGDIVRDYYSTGKKKQGDVIDAIIDKTGLTGVDADNLRMQLYGKMAEYRKEFAKKAIQRLTAEKKISVKDPAAFGKKLTELANEGALSNLAVKDLMRQKFGLPTLEGKDVTFILKEMDAYQKMPEGAAKDAQYEKVLKYLGNKMPKDALKQFNSWRRMAMLLSARTHAANLLGNAANVGMQKVADTMAMGFEQFIPKDQRTKAILTQADSHLVDMAQQDFAQNGMKDMRGSNRYEIHGGDSLARFGDTFKSKGLNTLSKFSMDALGFGDYLFYKPTYVTSLAQFMKARGLREVTPEARSYAKNKAEDVTLRKFSILEAGVRAMKRGDIGGIVKDNSMIKLIGTGLDVAMPFLKTPGNILRRGAEFSPLGGINVLAKIIGKASPSAIAEAAGKMFTGTFGAAFLGAWLTSIGVLDLDEYDGLYVVLPWGKYTIDWLQPISMSMAFGSSMQKTLENKGYSGDSVLQAFMDGGDTLVNGSVLQNFKSLLGGRYGTLSGAVAALPGQALNQSLPALSGQVARTIDTTVRSTYSPSKVVSAGKQLMAKTPGLSFLLPAKIDAMGKEMKQAGPVSQFLLPGRMVQEPTGRVADESKRLYEALKKSDPEAATGVKLNPAPSKFTRDSEQIVLTAKELEEFSRKLGEERERLLGIQISQSGWSSLSDSEKAKRFKAARDKAADITKDDYVKTMK